MPTQFYPALNSIIHLDFLPEELSFVKDGVDDLLEKVYFKDLQYTVSPKGDAAFYSLSLVSIKRIEFNIPGTGFTLVLNPDHTAPGQISSFPITVDWEWPILGYLHRFRTEGFSFDGGAFYEIATQVFNLPGDKLVEEAFAAFYPGPVAAAATQFVDAINASPSYSGLPYPMGGNPTAETANNISSILGATPARVIFEVFVFDSADDSVSLDRVALLFARVLGENILDFLKRIITPKFRASLQISAGIEFPRDVLVPLLPTGEPDPDTNKKSMLKFTTSGETFTFSSEEGFGYSDELVAELTPSQIGNTGLKIDITKAKLDLSKTKNIAEADADGRPADFVGVYVTKAVIGLPNFLSEDPGSTAEIYAERLLAGTGGISGTVGLRAKTSTPGATPAIVSASLGGGFEVGFSSFDITFQQNKVTGSNIAGYLKVPVFKDTAGNDAFINIAAHFDPNGDFNVIASEEQGIRALKLDGVLDVIVKSLFVGRKDGRFYIGVSGELDFAAQGAPIGQFIPDKIEVQKLIIWDDGKFEFEGGKITLPKAMSLSIGPVKLSITALGFGSHEQEHAGVLRQYSYFTFDGGVSVNPGGVDVQGNGVAFYFTTDNSVHPLHVFMRIQSISVDIIIPGSASAENAAVIIKGFLSMQQATPPATGTEYAGGIDLSLPKLKMGGSAAMRLNPDVPAFIIDVGIEMATPILLGSTGLGIYGFRGLLGQKYVASKTHIGLTDTDPWWQYYKKKVSPDFKEGVQVSKFAQRDGFSLGAGISLATAPDGGRTFSSKIFFLLSLPEVFLLQGQGQILKERIGLNSTQDPPFFALIAISSTSIETAFGVNYKIPDEGSNQGGIATVDGVLEMGFFWGNAGAWYINIGKDTPENRRIQVRLLTLFNVYFYLMLSSSGIRAGAGASYSLKKKWGPLKAELSAYIDVAGRMSFRPKQMGGSIQLGGTVEVSIFGIGFGLSGSASLVAEAAKPFMVGGSLKICVKVLWKKFCGTFEFNWTFDNNLNLDELPVMKTNLAEAGMALHMHTEETFQLWTGNALPAVASLTNFMVPMDSYIDLEMMKPVKVGASVSAKFGGSNQGSKFIEFFPPQRAKSDRVRHEYEISNVEIMYHNGTNWVPYDMYAAATPLQLAPFITTPLGSLPYGYWQDETPNEYTKLRVMAPSPLNYLSQGTGDTIPEDLGITVETIFCAPEQISKTCIMIDTWRPWLQTPINLPQNQMYFHQKYRFRVVGGQGEVVYRPDGGYDRAVRAEANESIELYFLEGYPCLSLHVALCSPTATVSYYRRVELQQPPDYLDQPQYYYQLIASQSLAPSSGIVEINYDDLQQPVDKVVLRTGNCKPGGDRTCENQATEYFKPLAKFLKRLIQLRHLAEENVALANEHYKSYVGYFFETILYTNPQHPNTRYSVGTHTLDRLYAEISDDAGYKCFVELWAAEETGAIRWERVIELRSFDTEPEGFDDRVFRLILAVEDFEGKVSEVKAYGRTCYSVRDCGRVTTPVLTAEEIKHFLNTMSSNNRFAQPMVELSDLEQSGFAPIARFMADPEIKEPLANYKLLSQLDLEVEAALFVSIFGDSRLSSGTEMRIKARLPKEATLLGSIRSYENLELVEEKENELVYKASGVLKPLKGKDVSAIDVWINLRKILRDKPIAWIPGEKSGSQGACSGCTDTLNPTGYALQDYLNTLLINRHLIHPTGTQVELFPMHNNIYDGIFQGTPLYYQYPVPQGRMIWHLVDSLSTYQINFSAIDNNDFRCQMNLSVLQATGSLGINNLVSISNLRLDPNFDPSQEVFNFIADAVFSDGKNLSSGQVKGTCCKALNVCETNCELLFYGACVLSYEDAVMNGTMGTQTQVTQEVQTMINAFNGSLQPVWRPYTNFAIRITTFDRLYRETGSTQLQSYTKTHVFGFRTTGTFGHFHEYIGSGGLQTERADYQALRLLDRQDEFKLKGLLHYMDFGKCYPNADGQLLNAKPLFYEDPKLYLYFAKPYVYSMLRSWDDFGGADGTDIDFFVNIKDPAPDPSMPVLPSTDLEWDLSPIPILSTEITVINNMITYGFPCANVSVIDPLWVNPSAELPDLRPLKLYTAIFNVGLKRNDAPANARVVREVLRYGFQTSRYPNFSAQVNSWKLKTNGSIVEKAAVFELEVEPYAELVNLATSLLNDSMDQAHYLRRDFGNPFNRLMDGIFKLTSLPAATCTEFNAVKDRISGRIYGILVRNPEPFNDPKMPDSAINGTLLANINGSGTGAWKVIWSTDRSQAFITNFNNSMLVPASANGVFTFVYKQWDGNAYNPVSTVITPTIQLP